MHAAVSVHVGLNRVDADHYGSERRLLGCRNDATAMYRLAVDAGFQAHPPLLDEAATARSVRGALEDATAALAPGGILLLTFAGHGARCRDVDAPALGGIHDGERDGHDEAFCLYDRMMRDDEVCGLLAELREGQRALAVVDCCHSGTVLDFIRPAGATGRRSLEGRLIRGIDEDAACAIRTAHPEVYRHQQEIRLARRSEVRATVLLLAACVERGLTPDGPEHGAFTEALLTVLEEPPAASYDELHARVAQLHRTAVLHPRDARTSDFRHQRPFQVHAAAGAAV